MINKAIKGTGVAVITPFTPEGEVDYLALRKILKFQSTNGIDFLVALGTTGEAVTLSAAEKEKVIHTFIEEKNGLPLVLGMGGNNTSMICQQINEMDFQGIDAILSVVPYYNKPSQQGLYLHFSAIAAVCPVPVILYNVPGRTGTNMLAETTLKLANNFDNIIAIKEASGHMEQIMNILKHKPDGFSLLSGDDALTYSLIALGADGVISVVANAFPAEFSSMVQLARGGNMEQSLALHYKLMNIIPLLFEEGSPSGIKTVLASMKLCSDVVRLPLVQVSDNHKNKIINAVDNLLIR